MGGCRILKQPGQKLRGGVLKGVLMGVVLIITGCGHLLMDPGHAQITLCFIFQVSATSYLQILMIIHLLACLAKLERHPIPF